MDKIERPVKPTLIQFQLSFEIVNRLERKRMKARLIRNFFGFVSMCCIGVIPCAIFNDFTFFMYFESLWFCFLILSPIIFLLAKYIKIDFADVIYSKILNKQEKDYNKYKVAFEKALEEYKIKSYAVDRALSKTTWEFWLSKTGHEFEDAVAALFMDKGYTVHLTGKTRDNGIDMILYKDAKKTVVQCKLYKNHTPPSIARDLYGTMVSEKADEAILVAPRGFSKATKDFVRDKPITLYDIDNLTQLMFEFEDYTPYWLANSKSLEEAVKYANKHMIPSGYRIKRRY